LPNHNKTFAAKRRGCFGRAHLSLALVLTLLLSEMPVVAQVATAASPARQMQTHGVHSGSSIDARVKAFAKNFGLNGAQQAAVKKILEQRQQETIRIRVDPSIAGSARIERFRALQENTVERIRAVLSEEQRKNYDPLAPRKLQPAPDQRSVEDWLKATTPK
jgi:hypothetical protein